MGLPLGAGAFYDQLSSDYHLLYADWEAAIDRQARAICSLLSVPGEPSSFRVLDCACGIGTQTIGLAKLGFHVTGVDISRKAVKRAQREIGRRRLQNARVQVADMRALPKAFAGNFDALVCLDNPLAHLLTDGELAAALSCMFGALRPGGRVLVGCRDYESARTERPTQRPIRRHIVNRRTAVVFQLWDWDDSDGDSDVYTNEHFVMRPRLIGWKVSHLSTRMRAYRRVEISAAAEAAGFQGVQWLHPEQTGYFQPLMLGIRPGTDT
jgi:glycine/sarcosine N-methyltransferase